MLAIVTSHPIQYQAPLWRALAAAGIKFEVWFLTPHAIQPSLDRQFGQTFSWDIDLLSGYPHRFLPLRDGWRMDRFTGIRLSSDWTTLLRSRGIQRIWVEGWRFATLWQAIHAAKSNGLEVWMRGETNDLRSPRGFKAWARRQALRWLFARIDHFLCIGTANRRFYEQFGIQSARLHRAPYSVDNAYFASAAARLQPQREVIRAQWGIKPDAFVILSCGKLIPKKRPLDVVNAVARAARDCPRPVFCLFAGDGELADTVRTSLTANGLSGCVTGFLNQSRIPEAYAAADCLVLPSDSGETWGLVTNEALASGLPVVVSNQCGCAEDLAAPLGRNHVFGCGDIEALAHSIRMVIDAPPEPKIIATIAASHGIDQTVACVQSILSAPSRNRS